MWRYSETLQRALRNSRDRRSIRGPERARRRAAPIIRHARSTGRTLLTEAESKSLLAAYGIPVVETAIASSVDEAVAARSPHRLPGSR